MALRMVYALRPGERVLAKIDTRTEEERQRDATNGVDIHSGLFTLTHCEDFETRCMAAKEGFDMLSPHDQRLLRSVLHLSPPLIRLVTMGEWARAATILGNLASQTSDTEAIRLLAVQLSVFEPNKLEDRRLGAGRQKAAAV